MIDYIYFWKYSMISKWLVSEKILNSFESKEWKYCFRVDRVEENPSWIINKKEKPIEWKILSLNCIFLLAIFILVCGSSCQVLKNNIQISIRWEIC